MAKTKPTCVHPNDNSIYCGSTFSNDISYYRYGTIGYIRTEDNEVRQCKCIGAKWVDSEQHHLVVKHEWLVAGLGEHIFSNGYYTSMGIIFASEYDAKLGQCKGAVLEKNTQFNYVALLQESYGIQLCRIHSSGTWDNIRYFEIYKPTNSGVSYYKPEIALTMDADGIHISIPDIDNGVGFASSAECVAHNPIKVFTFDDEDKAREDEEKAIRIKELETIIANAQRELAKAKL